MTAPRRAAGRTGGFTLIELMIAMLLGLIIITAVLSVFLLMLKGYRGNNALGDVQANSRMAFELLAHDIRGAQLTGCNGNGRVANVLNNSSTDWWANWNNTLRGYATGATDPAVAIGTANGARVRGSGSANTAPYSDSIQLIGAGDAVRSVTVHNPSLSTFTIDRSIGNLQNGGIAIVCDLDHATIFKTTSVTGTTLTYSGTNNCGTDLGFPTACSSGTTPYTFVRNSLIAPLSAVDWYIGNYTDGGTSGQSLYRRALGSDGTMITAEMVRNVTQMQLTYLAPGATQYMTANNVTDWSKVTAVQVQLTLQSAYKAGTDAKPLARSYSAIITLYNRVD